MEGVGKHDLIQVINPTSENCFSQRLQIIFYKFIFHRANMAQAGGLQLEVYW